MAEYIEKEYTIDKIKNLKIKVAPENSLYEDAFIAIREAFVKFLENIAPADVVEVVRCKDCIHRPSRIPGASDGQGGLNLEFPDDWCPMQCADGWYNRMPADDFFCRSGRRKAENNG